MEPTPTSTAGTDHHKQALLLKEYQMQLIKLCFALLCCLPVVAMASAPSGPMTIAQGGVYSGLNVAGTNTAPAINITTTDPVTITNSTITNSGADGVEDIHAGVSLAFTNCHFIGLNPNVTGKYLECALDLGTGSYGKGPSSVKVQHCTFTQPGHIPVSIAGMNPGATCVITDNWFVNMQGCPSDGNGDWQWASWPDARTHAIQVGGAPGINCQIEWNLVQNTPFQSSCDDVINLYQISGTASNHVQCSNNFVDGMYPGIINGPGAQHEDGAGFTTDGLFTNPLSEMCAYIDFVNDYAVNIGGKNIQIPIGHDITVNGFHAYTSGYTPDSTHTPLWSYNAGIIAGPGTGMTHDLIENSYSYGFRPPDGQFDPTSASGALAPYYLVSGSGMTYTNNTTWSASSTSAAALFSQWQSQLAQTGDYVGFAPPPTTPAITSLYLASYSVIGGASDDVLVQFNGALASPADVTIFTNNPSVTCQSAMRVYAGKSFNSFPVKTSVVSASTVVTITVSYGGSSASANLVLSPAINLLMSPTGG
jgi:hypothetical protein